ncbi:MAG: VWA domain-containing protein [Gammaproteobacteria bacterium]
MLASLLQFHFLRPVWLLALAPLAGLLWLLYAQRGADSAWRNACDPQLLAYLLVVRNTGNSKLKLWLLGLAWLIAVIALAGPVWLQRPHPLFQALAARIIVLDLSRSMLADDFKPSRLMRARFKINDILARSSEGQTGMVVFAGDAFVVAPLTRDTATIAALLPVLEPAVMPVQGGRITLGLRKAAELLGQAGFRHGEILLVTDSTDLDAPATAQALRAQGLRLNVLGVGTPAGAAIPLDEGQLLKDASGNIVIARLDTAALAALAHAGGGYYATISTDDQDLRTVLAPPDSGWDTETQRTDQNAERWREEGPWLVVLLLPVAAFAFRRGWLMLLALCFALPPSPAVAWGWDDLWSRRDQQADYWLHEGNARRALTVADDPWQRGTAAYRSGDFAEAAQAFSRLPGAEGYYNQGNALARLKRFQDALSAYDAALAADPGLEDARANRNLVAKLLEEQQQRRRQSEKQSPSPEGEKQPEQGGDNSSGDQSSGTRNSEYQPDSGNAAPDPKGEGKGDPKNDPGDNSQPGNSDKPTANNSDDLKTEKNQNPSDSRQRSAEDDEQITEEERQVLEQWLRRIPDDPGGLLHRKFLFQYRRRADKALPTADGW